jgi:predicted transcriptional regulator
MKKRVLLSIHPEFANAIFDGRKHFEFRRVIFKEKVEEVVVYATAPISQVVGCFRIEDVYKGTPQELWEVTKSVAGVSKKKFDEYFKDKEQAFAIKIAGATRFDDPKPLSMFLPSNTAPQSFCYI